jgi:hypothetical protein
MVLEFFYSDCPKGLLIRAKAMAVLILHGLCFVVWGLCPELWDLRRESRFSVNPM